MKKIFIEDSRVDSFMVDLGRRISTSLEASAGSKIPELVVVGVGESGTQLAERLLQVEPSWHSEIEVPIRVISVQKDEAGTLMAVLGASSFQPLVEYLSTVDQAAAYVVLDGVCRSGQTLTAIYEHVRRVSKRVWTYAIAVSADSILIPTWYGCLYEGSEYVVLTRQGATPNTPLFAVPAKGGQPQFNSPALVLRPPIQGDPDFHTGSAASISRYTSDDRFFDSTTRAKSILVLEWNSEPVGFIAFHIYGRTLWIDYIVACQLHSQDKKGIGTALYYHVENYAKLRGCENISLWAISDKVDWYQKRGFFEVHGARRISIGNGPQPEEAYHSMTHRLISEAGHYHV